jgi:hypothetical protein
MPSCGHRRDFVIAQLPQFVQHHPLIATVAILKMSRSNWGFVMRSLYVAAGGAFFLSLLSPVSAQQPRSDSAEAKLAALDARQKEMVAKVDVDGLAALSAPGLTINAPTNRILSRDQFLAMMRGGQIGAEAFERTVENVLIDGDVGVVMGSEVFTPTAESELGRTYGARPLKRRYTNVYVLHRGQWQWLARHANVVPSRSAAIR